jgi:hypothetical protein
MLGRLFPSPTEPDWYEWQQDPPLGCPVFVKVRPDAGGRRLVLGGLRVDGAPSAELLRAIPIGRIEAAANGQLTVPGDQTRAVIRPGHRPGGAAGPEPGGWDEPAVTTIVQRPPARAARGRPDRFYADVAAAYRDLAATSPRPACDLARRHGVPVTTAHRWVKEARRRGFLPPGSPGKAG